MGTISEHLKNHKASKIQIIIPEVLTNGLFYSNILPLLLDAIENQPNQILFDMQKTKLTNPAGIVHLAFSAALIKRKLGIVPRLILPESEPLLKYLKYSGFIDIMQIPEKELFYMNEPLFLWEKSKFKSVKGFHLLPLFLISELSHLDTLYKKMIGLSRILESQLGLDPRFSTFFSDTISEVCWNIKKHNEGPEILGFTMAQKMPFNVIQIPISDIGMGFRQRMVCQDDFSKFRSILSDENLIYKKGRNNNNLLAIVEAFKYRKESTIYGLWNVRNFVFERKGVIRIQSENTKVIFNSKSCQNCTLSGDCLNCDKLNYKVSDLPIPGVHIQIELPA